jgi:hypothetical protein
VKKVAYRLSFLVYLLAAKLCFCQVASIETYRGRLDSGVVEIAHGHSPPSSYDDNFWWFSGTQGEQVAITVIGVGSQANPEIVVYPGIGTLTERLASLPTRELPPLRPGQVPDPGAAKVGNVRVTLPKTDQYTVQVIPPTIATDQASRDEFDYKIVLRRCADGADSTPEPGVLASLGVLLLVVELGRTAGAARKRVRNAGKC